MYKKFFLLFCAVSTCLYSQNIQKQEEEKNNQYTPLNKNELSEHYVETTHTMTIDGKEISYKAVAGTALLQDDKNNKKASIFYVAYTKNDVEDAGNRPITFCFNGGPGSSSVWLHMGLLGPKRVVMNEDGMTTPPYRYINNEFSLLDKTDLVFIDPISTGFSRAVPGEDPKQYHGVDEDIKSIGEFIRLYVTRSNRWLSPKFLFGESYGTTRAVGLAGHLQEEVHMDLNGIVLISCVLNFQTLDKFDPGNDLPHVLYFPSFAAAAWFHKKLPDDLMAKTMEQLIAEAEEFAVNEYLPALMKGNALTGEQKGEMAKKMARFIGLTPQYIEQANLRVNALRFEKQLLSDQNRTIGRFDARVQGIDLDACSDSYEHDPSTAGMFGAYTATLNSYLRADLKWEEDNEYKILANVWPWNFGKATNRYLNMSETLQEVLSRNPSVKVFVGNGYYDLATPYFATEYTFNHIHLDPVLGQPITMQYYEGGHMMYTNEQALIKMKTDIANFYQNTLKNAHKVWNRLAR